MGITSLLIGIFQFIDQIYKSLIGILWYACIYYGLNPHFVFLLPFLSNHGFTTLQQTFLGGFYFQFSALALMFASIGGLILNNLSMAEASRQFFLKWLTAVIVGGVAFLAISWLMAVLGSIYGSVFLGVNFSWYNFLNFSSTSYLNSGVSPKANSLGLLIEIFALTGYFVSVTSLLAILMIRQALMLLAILIVPFATVLGSTRKGAKYATIIWELIMEMSVYPFLVLLSLYLAHIFSWDMPLQLAFLFLPTILPGLLFATGNSFLSAPLFGFLGGMSLGGVASRGMEAATIAAGPFRGGTFRGAARDGALMPLREKNFINQVPRSSARGQDMPWKEMLNEELKYRKERPD